MKLPVQLLKRKPDTHKGDYGYVLAIGGSPGLTGAVCLCAEAALRIGAGLVRVGVPKSLHNIFEVKLTEVMSVPLEESREGHFSVNALARIEDIAKKIDVIALGCGASQNISTQKLILKIIETIDKPLVIDADGINALSKNIGILKRCKSKNIIVTPHMGEFSRLVRIGVEEIKAKRKELVKDFAFQYNLILVLKGHRTLISDGKEIFENITGNPGMATAGSGDVLTGMIAGLIGQGLGCLEAARLGVYLHGLAGDLAAKDKTQNCLIASDIIEYLPKVIKKLTRR
ncbi:MAG: NAD(P)H-hydrate dehydratase [Candidatus Omnitrophota bacterium]